MKALLVIDMQENYLGKNAKSHYDAEGLIQNINRRIAECQEIKEIIIYIVNRFFYQRKAFRPQLADGLTAASELLFEKQHADCFSNPDLVRFLEENSVDEVEVVGIDGQFCVGMSALGAVKHGLTAIFNSECVGVKNKAGFQKMKDRLEKAKVIFI